MGLKSRNSRENIKNFTDIIKYWIGSTFNGRVCQSSPELILS